MGIMDYWPQVGSGIVMQFTPEQVETCLWAMAVHGGSSTLAHRQLSEDERIDWELPSHRTMRHWRTTRFKGRYEEILQGSGAELEQLVASRNVEFAMRAEDVKDQALRRTQAGLALANGVEASVILRNVTQAQSQSIERAGQLRGREAFATGVPGLADSLAILERLGVIQRPAASVDGSAEEETPPAAALPA